MLKKVAQWFVGFFGLILVFGCFGLFLWLVGLLVDKWIGPGLVRTVTFLLGNNGGDWVLILFAGLVLYYFILKPIFEMAYGLGKWIFGTVKLTKNFIRAMRSGQGKVPIPEELKPID